MASAQTQLPLVILAGSDRRRGPVPEAGRDFDFVVGYKAAEIHVGKRTLVGEIVERARVSGAFGEVYVAGPRRIYEELVDCRIIDTDGSVDQNIRAALREVTSRHASGTGIAVVSSDILPSAAEFRDLTRRLLAAADALNETARSESCALSFALVTFEASLGASVWKPRYSFRPTEDEEPIPMLPGHLAVLWPEKLRGGLLFRVIHHAYRERNRDYDERRRHLVIHALGSLLWRDLMNVLRCRPPTLTYRVLTSALGAFLRWRRGELTVDGLARAMEGVLVKRRCARRHPTRTVRIITTRHISFAKDFDTKEEIEEMQRSFDG